MSPARFTRLWILLFSLLSLSLHAFADPFPPIWDGGAGAAIHYSPAPWPAEPVNAADCGGNCGDWKPYTRFQNSVNDPRVKDLSNGGTAPQNYVNIASSCVDKDLPSIYYYLHRGATPEQDVIMFRWRVEQIANTYATGPSAGAYSASNPWSSALWTVLFDIDGSGFRSLAAHLNGSSGGPSAPIDTLAGIWSQSPTQSIDYLNDPNVHLLGHNPTAFIDQASSRILNFQNTLTPTTSWPNGSAESTWDYGTTRARLVSTRSCNEYFVDYQIPVAMLDASAVGGPKLTRSTPISMLFCTANSLNNPFQKDCAINKTWAADSARPAPFGDYISFDKEEPYSQPIVSSVTAVAPAACGQDYQLTAKVQDVLAVVDGNVVSSVKALDFYYWYDADGSGFADDAGGAWIHAASATRANGSLNTWSANWNATSLPKGRYLIGVQAVDDNTLVDDGITPTGVDNRTFSYVAGDAQSQVYIDGSWIAGQQAVFPAHSPAQTPSASENWYGNPEVTGIQTALVGVALNVCGVAPTLNLAVNNSEVAPGDSVIFTMTVSNTGNPNAVTVSSLSSILPDGFTYQGGTTSGGFGNADPTQSGQTLTWTFGTPVTVASNASTTLSFTATASAAAGDYNATASAGTSFGVLESDPVAVAVGSARLTLSMTPGSYSTSPGGQVSYTLNYSNPSPVTLDGVSLSSVLPSGTSVQSCTPGCSSGGGSVSWAFGSLAPGDGGSVVLVLNVDAAYASNALSASATLSGNDPASNPVTASTQSTIYVAVPVGAIAAFTLEKTASAVRVAPGASITYTLSYRNYGGAAANNVVLTDTLPAGVTYASCTGGCSHVSGTVTWNLGTVAAGASASVTVTATAANPFVSPNPAVNTASVSWDGGGPVTASASVGVTGQSCSTYYFRDTTTNVGFDGTYRVATNFPVPLAGDAGSSVTVTAPVSGAAYLEALRFYQEPASPADTAFSGTVSSWVYIDRANGQGLNLRATLYDYNTITGSRVQLGQQTTLFNGSTKGRLDFSVPVSGTLQKDHRLLWLIEVRSNHNSQTVQVQIQYNGTVSNAISGGTTFADSGASFCVTPPANLTINKTVDAPTVTDGATSPVVYTLTYANHGASTAAAAQIVDTLPAGVSFVSATLNSAPITPTGSNPYTFAIGSVAAGASGTLVINASVSDTATGLLTNTAALSSDQTSAVDDTANTLVGTPGGGGGGPTAPALYITKSANAGAIGASATVTYTLNVVNAGNADATNVLVSDDFPDQAWFAYVDCSTATGTCNESPAGSLTWNVGTLAAGAVATLTFDMQATATGIPNGLTLRDNQASVSDDDYCTGGSPPASCVSDTVSLTVSGNPALAIDLSASAATVAPGDLIEYTVTVSNNGSSSASNVVVYNPIPSHTGFIEYTANPADLGSFDTINNRALINVGTLAAGESASYSFTLQVNSPLASGDTVITDTATAAAGNAASVSASVSSTATAAAAVSVSLYGPGSVPLPATTLAADALAATTLSVTSAALLNSGDYIRVGGTFARISDIAGNLLTVDTPITASSGAEVQVGVTYSIGYQNSGNADATNVQLSEALPPGWLFIAASPSADSTPGIGVNGTVSWDLGTLASGASGAVQITALPTLSGAVTHTAVLNADDGIAELATLDMLIGGITVSKSVAELAAAAGGTVSYSITLSNSLTLPVNGVEVKDVLPAGFSYESSTPAPDSFDGGDSSRPVWIVDVAANGSTTIEFIARIAADAGAATYQNEVEVSAPAGVGVAQFDALSATAEDVTLLVGTGLMSGHVYQDTGTGNQPLAGVLLYFYENNVLAYTAYTDASGRFQQVLEAGNAWRVEIGSVAANSALLSGLSAAGDPESFSIASGEALDRTFVFSLPIDPEPVTVEHPYAVLPGAQQLFDIPAGYTLSQYALTRGGVMSSIDDPVAEDYADVLVCVAGNCTFTATRSGRYVFTYINGAGDREIMIFTVLPNVSFASTQQTGSNGQPVTVRVVLDDLPVEEQAVVPFSIVNADWISLPDPSDLLTRSPRVLYLRVGDSVNMDCVESGPCYQDLVFTPTRSSGSIQLTLLDTTDLDGARLGSPIVHAVNLVTATQLPIGANLEIQPGNTVAYSTPVTLNVAGLPVGGNFAFDWSSSDALLGIGGAVTQSPGFTAPAVAGVYALRVRVTDLNNLNRAAIHLETWLRVIAPADVASICGGDCSDPGSRVPAGRLDPACGLGVDDTLSIPYRLQIGEDDAATVGLCLETSLGYGLRLGTVSFLAAPNFGAGVSTTDVANFGNNGQSVSVIDDPGYRHIGLIYDFEVTGLDSAGQSVPVVIPLPRNQQIPVGAVWRKYHPVNGWFSYVSTPATGANLIFSAARVGDACPSPASSTWESGLIAGYDCIRLFLEDGGANDLDNEANAVIRDPGVLAVPVTPTGGGPGNGNGNGGYTIVSGGEGGGVLGPWTLLCGILGVLLRWVRLRVGMLLLALALLPLSAAAEPADLRGWYVGGVAAWAMGEADSAAVTQSLQAHGITATASVEDLERWAWRAFAGYRFNTRFAVEGGYTYLGEVTTRVATNQPLDLNDIPGVPPASGRGYEVAVVGFLPVTERVEAYARLGVWYWLAHYHVEETSQTRNLDRGGYGTLGVGARYALDEHWQASLSWDRYRIDAENVDLFGLGVQYNFR